MKKLVLVSIFAFLLVYVSKSNNEIGEKFDKQKRDEWINNMRGGNDGVYWQIIDRATINAKKEFNKMRNTLQKSSIADGKIIGEWVEKGSNNLAGRIRCVDIDYQANLLYAASDGGNIWKADLNGNNWQCLNNSFKFDNVQSIFIIKRPNGNRLIVADYSGGHIYYTDDDGINWVHSEGLKDINNWGGLKKVVVRNNAEKTIYAVGNEWNYNSWRSDAVMYYSNDMGASFKKVYMINENSQFINIWAKRYNGDDVFLVKKDSVFKVSNETIKFYTKIQLIEDYFSNNNVSEILLSGSEEGNATNLAVAISLNNVQSTNFYLFSSDDKEWYQTGSLSKRKFMENSFTSSILDIYKLYFGEVEMWQSEDGGGSFQQRNLWHEYYSDIAGTLHADIPAIQFFKISNDKELMYISTDGGLYRSENYGKTVKNISMNGLNVSQYYSTLTSTLYDNVVYAGAQDQGFQRSTETKDGTLGFLQLFSGDYGSITSSDGGYSLWSVYPNFVLYLQDAPSVPRNPNYLYWYYEGQGWGWMNPTVAFPGTPKTAYAIGGSQTNGSHLWKYKAHSSKVNPEMLPHNFKNDGFELTDLYINPESKNIYCTTSKDKLVRTKDGLEWETMTVYTPTGDNPNFYAKTVFNDPNPQKENIIYVTGRGYQTPGAFKSVDGGSTFEAIDNGLPKTMINHCAISKDGTMLFAATPVGAYVYLTWMNKWYPMETTESPDQDFRSVEILKDNTVRFATYGRGIWDFKISEVINSIKDDLNINNFAINIFPNPAENSTSLEFNISQNAYCNIKIYDIEGRLIKELCKESIEIGYHTFNWDLTSLSGIRVAKGTYICIVSINGKTNWKNIIVN